MTGMEEKDYSLSPADEEKVKRQTLRRPTPKKRRALSVRPTSPLRAQKTKTERSAAMEDNAPSPNDAEKKLKDGSVTEPEFASYYAAAASAADYRPEVAAHRGASGYLPEHTLPAKAMA